VNYPRTVISTEGAPSVEMTIFVAVLKQIVPLRNTVFLSASSALKILFLSTGKAERIEVGMCIEGIDAFGTL
jgi:hypothetical protein